MNIIQRHTWALVFIVSLLFIAIPLLFRKLLTDNEFIAYFFVLFSFFLLVYHEAAKHHGFKQILVLFGDTGALSLFILIFTLSPILAGDIFNLVSLDISLSTWLQTNFILSMIVNAKT